MSNTTHARIFVTTKEAHKEQNKKGMWFNLHEYSDAKAFKVTARQWCESYLPNKDGSQVVPYYISYDIDILNYDDRCCNFHIDSMLGIDSISNQVWELLNMNGDDRRLLNAFCLNTRNEPIADIQSKLGDARRQFIGKFDSHEKFGKALFEKAGFADDMPQELFKAINFEQVADILGNDTTCVQHHYFYTEPQRS